MTIATPGEPESTGYCHCSSCLSWSGGPVNPFTLWKLESVRIEAGAEHVATDNQTPISDHRYCSNYGGHLMTDHPTLSVVDVFLITLPTLDFTPGPHVNFVEMDLPMKERLPRHKDITGSFGGQD